MCIALLLGSVYAVRFAYAREAVEVRTQTSVTKQVLVVIRCDVPIRFRCMGHDMDHNFFRDLAPGQALVSGVDLGLRYSVAYQEGGSEILARKGFKLEVNGKDVEAVISGDKANGYIIRTRYLSL